MAPRTEVGCASSLKAAYCPERVISHKQRTHLLAGWRTTSAWPIRGASELTEVSEGVDVSIELGEGNSPIRSEPDALIAEHTVDRSWIRMPRSGDFEIAAGARIRIWPAAGASQKDIDVCLFGIAWATLCHQRGALPLHASGILTESGIVAFAGPSGSGKSTAAAFMSASNDRLFADDIVPVSFNSHGVPGAWPYLRRCKLKQSSVDELSVRADEPVSDVLDRSKYFFFPRLHAPDAWNKLARIYLLQIADDEEGIGIEELHGADALQVLIDQTYHFDFLKQTRGFGRHLTSCSRVASHVSVYRARRGRRVLATELGAAITAHLGAALSIG